MLRFTVKLNLNLAEVATKSIASRKDAKAQRNAKGILSLNLCESNLNLAEFGYKGIRDIKETKEKEFKVEHINCLHL